MAYGSKKSGGSGALPPKKWPKGAGNVKRSTLKGNKA